MKFTTNRESLLKVLNIAQEVITNKSPVSILSNVLLQTDKDKVIVKCTNSAIKAVTSFAAEIEEEGELTVYCDKLLRIVSSLPMGEVELFNDGIDVIIKPVDKKVKFKMKSLAADKFPVINDFCFTENESICIASKDFKKMIKNTIFAVSDDTNRHIMTGCYFCKADDYITMVATDSRRMSLFKCPDKENAVTPAIIPVKMLSVVEKFSNDEGDILIKSTDKSFSVKSGNIEISTSLIEGTYPQWQKVLPLALDKVFTVSKVELEDAIKRAENMSNKEGRIQFNLTKEALEVLSPESELGSSKEEIAVEYDGEPVQMALNVQFLSDVLKVINADKISVLFSVSEENKVKRALLIKESGGIELNYTHIIMPMSVVA